MKDPNQFTKKILQLLIPLVIALGARAQVNLVPNGSFEIQSSCPAMGCQEWLKATSWTNAYWSGSSVPCSNGGTPDYYSNCGIGDAATPNTYHGKVSAQHGGNLMGIGVYNIPFPEFREYLSAPLNCPMLPGITYTVSFWITNGTNSTGTGAVNKYTVKNMGIHLSEWPIYQNGYQPILLNPTCEITSYVDTTDWKKYTFLVTPDSTPLNYITIGNFRSDSANMPAPSYPTSCGLNGGCVLAYYFIDNIEVLRPSSILTLNSGVTHANCAGVGSATVTPSVSSVNLSYSWSPGSYTTASVSNLAPGVYTVTATATGCNSVTATTQFTVNPPIIPTLTVSAGPGCPGYTSTLTVSGATAYTWQPSGSHSNIVITSPTSLPATYTVTGASSQGCLSTKTITINQGTPVGVNTEDVPYCTNAAVNVAISASSQFTGGPVSYAWQPGNLTGQTVYVSPTVTSVYTVTATSPAGCPSTAIMQVNVQREGCCSFDVKQFQELSNINGTIGNGSYLISNDITLSSSSMLQDAEFVMLPGVKIIVPNNTVLELDHVHLYACGVQMWQGIVVQDGGKVLSKSANTSLIEDAVVGIDVDGISNSANIPPVDIDHVVFNKNYTGIRIANSDRSMTTLPLRINACVFSSRDMPFSSPAPFSSTSWPNADMNTTDLRYETPGGSAGLLPPYLLQGYTQNSIKTPYYGMFAQYGIRIENIGNQSGLPTSAGVDIGYSFPTKPDEFNLFDGLYTGIDVTDASLTTVGNVFQSSDANGKGINHLITGQMNARLDLSAGISSSVEGNRFWDCVTAVNTDHVYEQNIRYGIFRSSNKYNGKGIVNTSNRFMYSIQQCEFNNQDAGITINAASGPYDMGSGLTNGTYADRIDIVQNFFGPEVNSSTPQNTGNEGLNNGILLLGNNGSNWQSMNSCSILGNKMDRVYRGIGVSATDAYPVLIGGNDIFVIDDYYVNPGADQYGIFAEFSLANLIINKNTVKGEAYTGQWNTLLHLIRSSFNSTNAEAPSPVITCNTVSDGYVGFRFDGPQPRTLWQGNLMKQKMSVGLLLANNGEIGTQGDPVMDCGAEWDDNGNSGPDIWANNYHTAVDGSSSAAPGSFLYCFSGSATTWPFNNGGGAPFSYPASYDDAKEHSGCQYNQDYPQIPSQRNGRSDGTIGNQGLANGWALSVFPNPSADNITIKSNLEDETLQVKITDMTGKVVGTFVIGNSSKNTLDISSLKTGMYFIEVTGGPDNTARSKFVKLN